MHMQGAPSLVHGGGGAVGATDLLRADAGSAGATHAGTHADAGASHAGGSQPEVILTDWDAGVQAVADQVGAPSIRVQGDKCF
jgi:hypothetical protein